MLHLLKLRSFFRINQSFDADPKEIISRKIYIMHLEEPMQTPLLFVGFVFKRNNEALILSVREMDNKEKSVFSKL